MSQEISLIVSSDINQGATNKSLDGSYFEINLRGEGIEIPKDAKNVNLRVEDTSIWWSVPNIITDVNDKIEITGPNVNDIETVFTVMIPQGLYDLSGLNQAVLRSLENQGAKIEPDSLVLIGGDEATSKVEIRLNYPNVKVDFTKTDTPTEILGFNSSIIGPFDTTQIVLAENIASFNQINSFLLHSDLTTNGIRFNNTFNQTISQILIDVSPGSQIVSKPFNPARISAQELAGSKRNVIRVWLTDDKNRSINMDEIFTARIVLSYN